MRLFDWFKSDTTLLREQAERERLKLEMRTMEAQTTLFDNLLGNIVHPLEPFFDPEFNEFFLPLGIDRRRRGDEPTVFTNEHALDLVRRQSRRLVSRNEWAINAVENRISHTVGTGMKYVVQAREEDAVPPETVDAVQAEVDAFVEANDWGDFEQETVRRCDRDGEAFLRMFPQRDGPTLIRAIEPVQVTTPDGAQIRSRTNGAGSRSFGIETDPRDVLTVVRYWVDEGNGRPQPVDARFVVHVKLNVDRNVKRGIPTLFPVRKNLDRVEKLLRNMSTVSAIQSAIAIIRRHNAPKSAVTTFADEKSDAQVTDPLSGQTKRIRSLGQPRIIDASPGTDYEFPAAGVRAEVYVEVLQAELRAVASRLVMPEFMFTSDASNSNFASTLIAESPALRNFLRLQRLYARAFRRVVWSSVLHAVAFGRLPVAEEDLGMLELQVEPPQLEVRDRKEETERNQVLHMNGVLSRTTWTVREGLDPDEERRNLDDEIEQAAARNPLPMPGDEEPEDEGGMEGRLPPPPVVEGEPAGSRNLPPTPGDPAAPHPVEVVVKVEGPQPSGGGLTDDAPECEDGDDAGG